MKAVAHSSAREIQICEGRLMAYVRLPFKRVLQRLKVSGCRLFLPSGSNEISFICAAAAVGCTYRHFKH
jgi:hypothetical protein